MTVASIASNGLATGTGAGTATITATSGSITASATLNVGPAILVSLAVTPANSWFALGTTLPLVATGTYSDGSTLVLTTSATWSTADSTIATVNSQGVASSVALGSTTVTATSGTISGSTTLTISPAVLVSIAVTPAIPTIPLGTNEQFTATGTYTDGSTQNITSTVQWSSDTATVATIGNAAPTQGLGSSVGEGTATITATSGSVSGSTTLTVSTAGLVSLAVTPATPSIALGTSEQFTATGTFTDGSTQDMTSTATWSSDTVSTAPINNVGLAQSTGIGMANITASAGTVSGSTELTVTAAALVSIAINPQTSTVALGATQPFTAAGTYTDGSTQDLTQSGHWSSTVATVATISNTAGTGGLASTLGTGTTTIGISSGAISATAELVVNPAVLVSIAINPQSPTIALGTVQQFTATGTYTDGSTQDLTTVVTWSSSSATVAIIGNAVGSYGLATSSGQGTATISATSNSISSSTSITVTQASLTSIAVTPASTSIALGYGEQFSATATYSDGSTRDITQSATWMSSVPAVAAMNSTGYTTSIYLGSTTISASSGSVTGFAFLVVNPSVAITPTYFGMQCGVGISSGADNCPNQTGDHDPTWPTSVAQPGLLRLWDSQVAWSWLMTAYSGGIGTYNWVQLDGYLDVVAAHQPRSVSYVFGCVPTFADGGPAGPMGSCGASGGPTPPSDLTSSGSPTFTQFVTDLTDHCSPNGNCVKTYIKYYELWNEANVGASGSHPRWDGTQTRLYQMVAPAVAVINANVPGATILTPSITNGAQAQTWMTGWLDAEIAGGVISDVYNIHYYLNNQLPENVLSGSANTLHGDLGPNYNTSGWTPLPWVVSETGYDDLTPPYGCNDGDTGTPYSTPDCVGQMVRWNLLQFSNTAALGSAPGGMGVWWYYWNSYIGSQPQFATAYFYMMQYLVGGQFNGTCSSTGTPPVWTCPFIQANGTNSLWVWTTTEAGTTYVVPSGYIAYRDLTGGTTTVTSGQSITIKVEPILLTTP